MTVSTRSSGTRNYGHRRSAIAAHEPLAADTAAKAQAAKDRLTRVEKGEIVTSIPAPMTRADMLRAEAQHCERVAGIATADWWRLMTTEQERRSAQAEKAVVGDCIAWCGRPVHDPHRHHAYRYKRPPRKIVLRAVEQVRADRLSEQVGGRPSGGRCRACRRRGGRPRPSRREGRLGARLGAAWRGSEPRADVFALGIVSLAPRGYRAAVRLSAPFMWAWVRCSLAGWWPGQRSGRHGLRPSRPRSPPRSHIANRQADIAAVRHEEQTSADRQRRITDTFSKAVEQLACEKVEVRLGGIYTLERPAGEAPVNRRAAEGPPDPGADAVSELYWTVMQTLTAFARWQEPEAAAAGTAGPPHTPLQT
jgi:hypothetical protein